MNFFKNKYRILFYNINVTIIFFRAIIVTIRGFITILSFLKKIYSAKFHTSSRTTRDSNPLIRAACGSSPPVCLMRLNRDKKPALIARATRWVHEGLRHVEPHCQECELIKLNCLDDAAQRVIEWQPRRRSNAIMRLIRETNYPHLLTDPVKALWIFISILFVSSKPIRIRLTGAIMDLSTRRFFYFCPGSVDF